MPRQLPDRWAGVILGHLAQTIAEVDNIVIRGGPNGGSADGRG
jgi:hypothetical protein